MTLLEVSDLTKSFGSHRAVSGVSFRVQAGEIFGLLGPNGAGKSTTLAIICGLLKPGGGSVAVDGWNMAGTSRKAKDLIGIVPQEPALYPRLSARMNLRFWGTLNGLKGSELDKAVNDALVSAGLEERAGEQAGKYSGGMKRRLNVAAGLVHNPRLLIMDEPTVGVDAQSRSHILETVKKLQSRGTTVIYTSHYVEEVEYLCDRVAVMDEGKILAEGTVPELLSQAGEYQELLITLDRLPGEFLGRIQSLPGVESACSFDRELKILTASAEKILPLAFATIIDQGFQVSEIKIHKPNLEGLFLKLTGRALRD